MLTGPPRFDVNYSETSRLQQLLPWRALKAGDHPGLIRPAAPLPARRAVGIRMRLPTTERRFWHCGAHTAKPESA